LREHGREALSKSYGVNLMQQLAIAAGAPAAIVEVGNNGVNLLMTLPNSRTNENEADLIGLELAARAGYNPNAAITLWEKMSKADEGAPPEFLSTHPSSSSRTAALQGAIPKVMPLYENARKS
jgi:predicted Zn-dependent protease